MYDIADEIDDVTAQGYADKARMAELQKMAVLTDLEVKELVELRRWYPSSS